MRGAPPPRRCAAAVAALLAALPHALAAAPRLVLYTHGLCPYSQRVAMALALIGEPTLAES